MSSKRPIPPPDPLSGCEFKRPTSPPPPRKRMPLAQAVTQVLVVGEIVDQLENTIRVLIGLYKDKAWQQVTRGEIEWYIELAEERCSGTEAGK